MLLVPPPCAHPERRAKRLQLWHFFSVDEGRESGSKYHFKWAIIGPPAKHHLNGVMPFSGGLIMVQHCMLCDFPGVRTSIANESYSLVIFQGTGKGPPAALPVSAHAFNGIMAIKICSME